MKYFYILLICLILYYIITRYFEKYYSQENFDPSLVPVSSIITLAKVAQKIVDGNGTLTNPANLNIGTTNAKGNLLVTGNSRTNGNKQVDGTLGVTGATTVGGTLGVTGATTVGSTLGVTGATTVGGTLGVTGAITVGGSLGVTGATTLTGVTTIGVSGISTSAATPGATNNNLIVNGATTIGTTGTSAATTSLTVNGATKINGPILIKDSPTGIDPIIKFGDNTGHVMRFYTDTYDYLVSPPKLVKENVDTGTRITDNGDIVAGRNLTGGNISLTKGFVSASSATNAELSSDTGSYKTLMILGNTARGSGTRNIAMWDNVAISGVLSVGSMSYEGTATTGKVNIGGVTTMKGYGSLYNNKLTITIPATAYKYPIAVRVIWSDGAAASRNNTYFTWTGSGPSGTGAWKISYQGEDCCFPLEYWPDSSKPNFVVNASDKANAVYIYEVEYVGI